MTLSLGTPITCLPGTVGWPPDYTAGKLVFLDASSYTIPNYAVRFVGGGPFELHVATIEGDDVETIQGRVAYPKRETVRTARIACQMLFGTNKSGVTYNSLQQGMTVNWSEVTALSDDSWDTANGLQTVRYEPYVGGPTYQFEAHVLPPVVGEVAPGIGMAFGIVLEVPNPSAVLP